jgi:hypothetical protein
VKDKQRLLEQYVATFERLGNLRADQLLHPTAWLLSYGDPDPYGFKPWRPAQVDTAASGLEEIYRTLPARFPPLYESLVLSYRWAEVDLRSYRLLANPPGPGLGGLFAEMSGDPGLWEALLPAGYMPFGKGPDIDYDPICFDIKSRSKSRDYRIVKIDHEEILCNSRIKVVAEMAPSFEELVVRTIQRGQAT